MKSATLTGLGVVAALVVFVLVGWGLGWFGLVAGRPMATYAKETERQVYQNSVAHQQGANSGIGIDCANMRNVSLPVAQRHAFAGLVTQDAAAFSGSGSLSPDSQACIAEANTLLGEAIPQANTTGN